MTPLQLARAVTAVANGGRLLRPFVVASVERRDGAPTSGGCRARMGQAIPPAVAAQLTLMLRGVVRGGTGRKADVPGYPVAGKTGTAQKVVDGRYSQTRFIASFAGFAPFGAPAWSGVVALDEPHPLYHGGDVAAPVFAAVARQVLPYWGVPPEPEPPAPPGFELVPLRAADAARRDRGYRRGERPGGV